MDLQTAITIIVALVALVVILLAIYVFLVLRELRQTVKKLNSMLTHMDFVTELLSDPTSAIVSLVNGIISTIHSIKRR